MEEEDPVVQEIDVFLTRALSENLYMFQYPVRQASANYDDIRHLQAKVKPKQQKIELELAVNTHSPNFDSSKGEQIVLNVDGKNPSGAAFFKSGRMDKQILSSTKAVPSVSRYAIGLLRSGELHLTPLHAIVQLRPSFNYLDLSDSRAKLDSPNSDDKSMEEEEEIKAVTVKFAGPQTEKSKQAKERSYRFIQHKMASEAWVNARYHPNNSTLAALECNQLYCSKMDHDASDLPGTCSEYIKALLPNSLALDPTLEGSPIGDIGLSGIKAMALPEQIRTIMSNAKVLEFRQLLEFIPGPVDSNQVLRSLQLVAMLIQGCWVIKSELLYPKETKSSLTGVSAEILCHARDYIMWRFTQTRLVKRGKVLAAVKIPDEDCKALLSEMAKPCPTQKGWEFLFPFDKEFVSSHPDVLQRQQMLWEARGQQINRTLLHIDTKNKITETKSRQRKHRKSLRESCSDDTEGSGAETPKTRESNPARLSFNGTLNPAMDVDSPGPGGAALFEISPTSLRPTSELKQELNVFVRERLRCKFCFTLNEMKRALMVMLTESPPGHPLSTGVTDQLLEEAVVLAGGQRINNKWPQNNSSEPLFVFTKFGDTNDKIREALVDMFSKTARIRSSTFQKKVEDELSETMSEQQNRKLLQDYCIVKSGFYYLKGTISPDV